MPFLDISTGQIVGQIPGPQPVQPSPTAVQGQMDQKDFLVYGSILCVSGGTGEQQFFGVNKGSKVPSLGIPSVANPPPQWYTSGSDQTTNLIEASKFGSLGDGNLRAIAISAPQAKTLPTGGGLAAINTWGATAYELMDLQDKTTFFFKIGTKEEIQGPTGMFPANEGTIGAVSTTANNSTNTIATNGVPAQGRQLRYQPRIMRTDNFEGKLKTAPNAALAFIRATTEGADGGGQPVLVQCILLMSMDTDRR